MGDSLFCSVSTSTALYTCTPALYTSTPVLFACTALYTCTPVLKTCTPTQVQAWVLDTCVDRSLKHSEGRWKILAVSQLTVDGGSEEETEVEEDVELFKILVPTETETEPLCTLSVVDRLT